MSNAQSSVIKRVFLSSMLCFIFAFFLPNYGAAISEKNPVKEGERVEQPPADSESVGGSKTRGFSIRNPQSAIHNREAGGEGGEKVGTVIAVEEDEIRFDIGSEDGITVEMRLWIYRKVIVIHPLTKQNMGPVQTKIGELEVTEVAALSSLGKIRSQETAIKKGDRVSRLEKEAVESEIRKESGEDGRKKEERKKEKGRRKARIKKAATPSAPSSTPLPLSPSPPPAFRGSAIPEELSASEDTASSLLERALRRKYRGACHSLYSGAEGGNDLSSSQTSAPSMEPYEAHFWAGQYLYQKGRYSDAVEHFKAMLEDGSRTDKNDRAGVMFGFCCYELGNLKEAMRAFEKMLADYSESPYAPQAQSWIARIEEEKDERKK
jgi:TolA-binding protein